PPQAVRRAKVGVVAAVVALDGQQLIEQRFFRREARRREKFFGAGRRSVLPSGLEAHADKVNLRLCFEAQSAQGRIGRTRKGHSASSRSSRASIRRSLRRTVGTEISSFRAICSWLQP